MLGFTRPYKASRVKPLLVLETTHEFVASNKRSPLNPPNLRGACRRKSKHLKQTNQSTNNMPTKHRKTKSQAKTKARQVSKSGRKRVNSFKRMLAIFLYKYKG